MPSSSCPADEQLRELLDESRTLNDLSPLCRHLEKCSSCQSRLEEIVGGLSVPTRDDREATRIEGDSVLGNLIRNLKTEPQDVGKTVRSGEPYEHWRAALDPPRIPESLGHIGDYDLTKVLGSGGMGVVLRGRDAILDREVAIKFPHLRLTRTANARQRFLNEARLAATLEHENVVRVYQVGIQHDEPYLVMELVEGETLQDLMKRDEPVSNSEIRSIAIQAARALEAAHQEGLIHGDVKPANLLINRKTGQLKLGDFGLARAIEHSQSKKTRSIAGTPEYMSPEQAGGRAVDARADLYSLGAVLYALATGKVPLIGKDLDDLFGRIQNDSIEPVRRRSPTLDRDLARMIDQLLQKKPDDRPNSAAEVAATLSLDRRRFRRKILVAALSTITLVACFLLAEFAGWSNLVAGIGPRSVVDPPLPFLIVGRDIDFETLQEAIENAQDGDTIEVRSSGPHAVTPIQIRDKSLTIRGADGQPAIVPFQSATAGEPLIATNAALTLESLEVNFQSPALQNESQKWQHCAVFSERAPLRISKCRFRISKGNAAIAVDSSGCLIDNCEVYGGMGIGVVWRPGETSRLSIRNSVMSTRVGIYVDGEAGLNVDGADVELKDSTFRVGTVAHVKLNFRLGQFDENIPRLRIDATDNHFEASHFFSLASLRRFSIDRRKQRGRWLFRRLFVLRGKNNRMHKDALVAVLVHNPPEALFDAIYSKEAWSNLLDGKENAIEFGTINFTGSANSQNRDDHQVESFDAKDVDSN